MGIRSARAGEVSSGWSAYPNLRLRPHAPAAGRGRLQVQIRRAFVGHRLLSSSQVYDSAPNNRRSLYRIAHLAFVTVYLVGQLAPLVASSVSCVSRPDRGIARALCSHSSAFARTSLGVTRHPPRTKHDGLY